MGIGDWGLGIGDWAQSPIPNPQSPIPKKFNFYYFFIYIFYLIKTFFFKIYTNRILIIFIYPKLLKYSIY